MSRKPTAASAAIAPTARPLASSATKLLMPLCSRELGALGAAPLRRRWRCGRSRRRRGFRHDSRKRSGSKTQRLGDAFLALGVELHDVGNVLKHVEVIGLVLRA